MIACASECGEPPEAGLWLVPGSIESPHAACHHLAWCECVPGKPGSRSIPSRAVNNESTLRCNDRFINTEYTLLPFLGGWSPVFTPYNIAPGLHPNPFVGAGAAMVHGLGFEKTVMTLVGFDPLQDTW